MHIQSLGILHIGDNQSSLRWDPIYFLGEKLHLHGRFGCHSELTSNKVMQISFLLFYHKNALFNFNSQTDPENEIFLGKNILHFILKCTEYHKICTTSNGCKRTLS